MSVIAEMKMRRGQIYTPEINILRVPLAVQLNELDVIRARWFSDDVRETLTRTHMFSLCLKKYGYINKDREII